MERMEIKTLIASANFGSDVIVMGWVRTIRVSKNVSFIALNDGSCLQHAQLVADAEKITGQILATIHSGAALKIEGKLVQSQGK